MLISYIGWNVWTPRNNVSIYNKDGINKWEGGSLPQDVNDIDKNSHKADRGDNSPQRFLIRWLNYFGDL